MDGSSPELDSMRPLEILEPELLRGASLKLCLRGRYWRKGSTSGQDFHFSRPTDSIDYFFSHDWETSYLLKWMTLVVVFNSKAAAVAMVLTTLLCTTLAVLVLPKRLWNFLPLLSYAAYWAILLFWQDLRQLRWAPRMAFLEKLCIAQHDAALKDRGIKGLGSFIRCSKSMTILWSGRYFSRLWCCYEVASFLKTGAERPLELLPVHMSLLLLLSSFQVATWVTVAVIFLLLRDFRQSFQASVLLTSAGLGTLITPVLFYVALQGLSLYELPQQLANFQVLQTKCFCCSVRHVDANGRAIPCDRKLLFTSLEKWFHDQEDWVESFNLLVRERMQAMMSKAVGRGLPPLQYVLCTVCTVPVPLLSALVPRWVHEQRLAVERDDELSDSVLERRTRNLSLLIAMPLYGIYSLLCLAQACRLLHLVSKRYGYEMTRALRVTLSVLLSPLISLLIAVAVWFPLMGQMFSGPVRLLNCFIYALLAVAVWAPTSVRQGGVGPPVPAVQKSDEVQVDVKDDLVEESF